MKMRRFLTVSTIVLTSALGVNQAAHAGIFSKPAQKSNQPKIAQLPSSPKLNKSSDLAALPGHTITLAHAKPADLPKPHYLHPKPVKMANTRDLPAPNHTQNRAKPHHDDVLVKIDEPKEMKFFIKSAPVKKARTKKVPDYGYTYLSRVKPFKGIAADGNIFVTVESSPYQEVKVMNINYPGFKLVELNVKGNVLVLRDVSRKNIKDHPPEIVHVNIKTPTLTSIHLKDNSRLAAKGLKSNLLDINAATTGFIRLKGNIGLHHVYQRGPGPISVEWANSDHIKVVSRSKGPIHIAGNTDHLNIRADDRANIDAKHLRAHSGLIQTADHANVAVTVIDALSGFATGMSNIFYYKTPKHLTRHTYDLGNVMQLRYWN